MFRHIYILLFTVLCYVYNPAQSYFVTVDALAEECFFDRVEAGTNMGLTFEIAEGGFLDIDVRIIDPEGGLIHTGERESSGKYTFAASTSGVYTYCFSNKMSTMTPKVVMFNMMVGEAPKTGEAGDGSKDGTESATKLEDMIRELAGSLTSVKNEQEYMQLRDRIHRSINENTNSRVVLWSFFEAVILVAMTFGQVYYLKRFFEVRRVV